MVESQKGRIGKKLQAYLQGFFKGRSEMEKKSKVDVKAKPGELEAYPHPGLLFPEVLKEEGVEMFFGIWGGHMWPWIDPMIKEGIKHITVRHESTAGYAAEAYSRVTGKIGVCCGTVGPGSTNIMSAVHQAHLSNTSVLVLLAGHEANDDGAYTLQECYAEKLYESFAKLAKRVIDARTYKFWFRKAIRTALKPPRGPAVLEFELNALTGPHPTENNLFLENWLKEPIPPTYPDPKAIERVLDIIYSSEKPAMYVGDEVMWNDAEAELREFVHLAQIPTMGRRGGRGSLPEDDPLIWKSADIGVESDLFIILGARLDFFDFFGNRFQIKKSVQIAEALDYIHPWVPTEFAIQANVKTTLRAMIDYIKKNNPSPPSGREAWLEKVKETEKSRVEYLEKRALQFKDVNPVHPAWLSKVICDTVDEMYKGDVYYIFDAFTGSNILSPYIQAKFTGQVIDSGPQAGVGHGIGQAIGASLGCDKKKMVFAMMGDAGMGLHGMDVETAIRHKLPIVFLVNNNDGWIGGSDAQYGKNLAWYGIPEGEVVPHYVIPDQRYDLMFEAIGCHAEWITEPDQVRPGLERAFKAAEQGKTAVVNVKVDKRPLQSILDSPICALMWKHLPWNETTRYMRKMRAKFLAGMFPFDKYGIEPEPYDRWDLKDEDFELGIPE
ncbi:MAG TPA: thiamine pyrophosphate-binding protein [Candidatus Latescibacteria bacterium]|nr:thiamine pyrophosphate-binding protein [Candidatus Latescibacterota bacterium]